jgi:hypothetical protein
MPRVVSARSRVKTLQRRVRRGKKKTKSRPARVTPRPEAAPVLEEKTRGPWDAGAAEDWTPTAAGEMVRLVAAGAAPMGVTEDGVKTQTAPAGRPLQAKVMGEWKPPVVVAIRVTGLEALPWTALVEAVDGDRVKPPVASMMVKVAGAEVLA